MSSTPTIILVHGAFADGSSWGRVIPHLQAEGLAAAAVQNPLVSLDDDVAHLQRAIDRSKGPVVLVGHSWGGAVITQAGGQDRVAALVYVAAFAPDIGQSPNDTLKPYPPSAGLTGVSVDRGRFLTLTPDGMARNFAQDLPADEAALLAAVQGPVAAACFASKVSAAAWTSKPSWYVVATQDRMLPPPFLRDTAARIGARTVEVESGHAPHLSNPRVVAAVIIEAARTATP
ncbi:alpha/beta fold hydrolase [Azospirillum picis]|uniref:Pimeloyl-ACP methyl ester carboxylesterase n=1 Tax=Azospirillum picis TaxID=488438 RepID=A0ABU0MDH5_9PROT|nr:alpha/beta hydrolase [Azospirillum picis]MBP2297661.1 pimeloyl-ACP methyl ester carboxylesterase [Azospirillum picis]MDQ0531316.1 pimeloyl-ACP methyl ester carboxylesterase [Azospirillum picis]